jgi:sugar O-acyltransferase (sialic acid O-acetyltransferase NeuD family)
MIRDIIFWGASGHAKVLRECVGHEGRRLVAVFDNNRDVPAPFADVPIYFEIDGFESWLASRNQSSENLPDFLVAIGGDRGAVRLELHERLSSYGVTPLTAIHPTAFVASDVRVGAGSQLLAHATVCVDVTVGRQCIINTGANVDHECLLEDGVHICPGATLAGLVKVGRCAMIGSGAVVLPRRVIGDHAIVGAGAVVTRDVPERAIVVGNPARLLRQQPTR